MLQVGSQAPSFRGRDQHGREVSLEDMLRRGHVVLYFYSKDFTPICTRQACAFRDAFEELRDLGAQIVGVSVDDEEVHQRFAATHQIPFPLLADVDQTIQRSYGAFAVFGLFRKRLTFVIDRGGIVRAAIHHEMRPSRHADDVREVLGRLPRY
jgi:peroxiredoxin Q/BCP